LRHVKLLPLRKGRDDKPEGASGSLALVLAPIKERIGSSNHQKRPWMFTYMITRHVAVY
jgi:hypothetical protein